MQEEKPARRAFLTFYATKHAGRYNACLQLTPHDATPGAGSKRPPEVHQRAEPNRKWVHQTL